MYGVRSDVSIIFPLLSVDDQSGLLLRSSINFPRHVKKIQRGTCVLFWKKYFPRYSMEDTLPEQSKRLDNSDVILPRLPVCDPQQCDPEAWKVCFDKVDPAKCQPDMYAVWKEVWHEEAKHYARTVLRLAKKTRDFSECHGATSEAINRIYRVREIESIFAQEANDRNDGKAVDRWFVTFNPPGEFDPVVLWDRVTTYLKKNDGRGIFAWFAVIEQRSEDPERPHGWHMHICIQWKEDLARSIVYQKLKATAAHIWSDDQMRKPEYKKYWLTVKPLEEYHRKYVTGEKREEKMAKVEADKIARGAYGFPEFLSGSEKIFPGNDIVEHVSSELQKESHPQA